MEKPPEQLSGWKRFSPVWPWVVLLAVLVFAAALRVRMLDLPLERDEGEYAYAGQLLLCGVPPYTLAYNMKLPGTYLVYAGMLGAFGETERAIRLGLLLVNAATIVLVFLLGRRLFDAPTGAIACLTYGLTSLSPGVLGMSAHANHFVIFFALWAILVLLRAVDQGRAGYFFFSGSLFGVAFLMKQQGIFFLFLGGCYLLWQEFRTRPTNWTQLVRRAGVFSLGAIIPFAVTCLVLFWLGAFSKFWFWTFSYSSTYATLLPLRQAGLSLMVRLKTFGWPEHFLWMFAAAGLVWLLFCKNLRSQLLFLAGLLLASIAAVSVGFYFRAHYFILTLPVQALLSAIAVRRCSQLAGLSRLLKIIHQLLLGLFVLTTLSLTAMEISIYHAVCQINPRIYAGNPFRDAREVGLYIREHSAPDARVAVVGSEPEIYFYSQRQSATGYIYTYALMETHPFAHQMQLDMIREIETARPEFFVFVNSQLSWMPEERSEKAIINWAEKYWAEFYEVVGIIDTISNSETKYVWGGAAKNYLPQSKNYIFVFRRKPTPHAD